jgi:hypothetical protein
MIRERRPHIIAYQQEGALRRIKRPEALSDTLKPLIGLFVQSGWRLAMGFAADALRALRTQLPRRPNTRGNSSPPSSVRVAVGPLFWNFSRSTLLRECEKNPFIKGERISIWSKPMQRPTSSWDAASGDASVPTARRILLQTKAGYPR